MQAEKFYKHIQEKIEQSSTEPAWNKNDAWQRIEQRNAQKKSPFVFWQAAAASIALISIFGVYFFTKNNSQVADSQVIKEIITPKSTPIITNEVTKSTPKILVKKQRVLQPFDENKNLEEVPQNAIVNKIDKAPILENTIPEKSELAINQEKELIKSDEIFTEKPSVEKASFVANQAILDVRIPKKRERVAILEIPDDNENYAIPQKEKRRTFATRLARKIDKKATTEELPSLDVKSSKIWAFVKQSFKNETMVVDSTEK